MESQAVQGDPDFPKVMGRGSILVKVVGISNGQALRQ